MASVAAAPAGGAGRCARRSWHSRACSTWTRTWRKPAPSPPARCLRPRRSSRRWRGSSSRRRAAPCRRAADRAASGALALDVPQRDVHAAHRVEQHRAVAPVRAHVARLPDVLDLVDVAADEERLEVLSSAVSTTSARCVKVAQPQPTSPGSVVSTFTTTRRMRLGAVRIVLMSRILTGRCPHRLRIGRVQLRHERLGKGMTRRDQGGAARQRHRCDRITTVHGLSPFLNGGLPPSLKLRRTTVSLGEGGRPAGPPLHPQPPAVARGDPLAPLRSGRPRLRRVLPTHS